MGRSRREQRKARPRLSIGQTSTGVIVVVRSGRPYGFIRPDGGAANVYFHLSDVAVARQDALRVGQRVQFTAQSGKLDKHGRARLCAVDVT